VFLAFWISNKGFQSPLSHFIRTITRICEDIMKTQQYTTAFVLLRLLLSTPSSVSSFIPKINQCFQPNHLKHGLIHGRKKQYHTHRQIRLYNDANEAPVNVYDDVFDPQTCKILHRLTLAHSKRSHDGSSLFHRHSSPSDSKLTPLEKAIDSILASLNDTSPMVEYWSRPTYINMDAHADIDENTLKEEGILRCPRNGHVLYLQIYNSNNEAQDDGHDDKSKRMGPTVVFPERKVVCFASDLSRPRLGGNGCKGIHRGCGKLFY